MTRRRLASALGTTPSLRTPPSLRITPAPVAVGQGSTQPQVRAGEPMPGPLVLDLIAALIAGGAPPPAALEALGAALRAVGDSRGEGLLEAASRMGHPDPDDLLVGAEAGSPAVQHGEVLAALEEVLDLSARAGLPPTELVRRAAVQERRRQLSAQLRAIRRLEVLLVIPAGLCLLPAFVLLGIVPLVIDLITR